MLGCDNMREYLQVSGVAGICLRGRAEIDGFAIAIVDFVVKGASLSAREINIPRILRKIYLDLCAHARVKRNLAQKDGNYIVLSDSGKISDFLSITYECIKTT